MKLLPLFLIGEVLAYPLVRLHSSRACHQRVQKYAPTLATSGKPDPPARRDSRHLSADIRVAAVSYNPHVYTRALEVRRTSAVVQGGLRLRLLARGSKQLRPSNDASFHRALHLTLDLNDRGGPVMKASRLLTATLLLVAGSATVTEPVAAKTHAQARQELVQAWRDGWLPYNRHDYPPTATSLARNRARYCRSTPDDCDDGVVHTQRPD
jgi:hypothetical protein